MHAQNVYGLFSVPAFVLRDILSTLRGLTHKPGRDVPDVPGLAPKPSPGHFQGISAVKQRGRERKGAPEIQARKRHINIIFLVRLLLGHPGNVPGTNRVCPRDKVGLSQGQTQVFSLLYTVEAQCVPRTNPVCPGDIPGTKGGRKSLCVKSLCAFFVPQKSSRNFISETGRYRVQISP